jgi:uncharacterized protein
VGEAEDARIALAFLRSRYARLPFSLAGFSFGSRIILKIGCQTPGSARLIAVGFPAVSEGSQQLGQCDVPRVFIHSTQDEFCAVPCLESYFAGLQDPKQLIWVEASDHFFAGALDNFEDEVYRVGSMD